MAGPPSTDSRRHVRIAGVAPERSARPARWILIPPQIAPKPALANLGVYATLTAGRPQPR